MQDVPRKIISIMYFGVWVKYLMLFVLFFIFYMENKSAWSSLF